MDDFKVYELLQKISEQLKSAEREKERRDYARSKNIETLGLVVIMSILGSMIASMVSLGYTVIMLYALAGVIAIVPIIFSIKWLTRNKARRRKINERPKGNQATRYNKNNTNI